jgi:hypothetical protein
MAELHIEVAGHTEAAGDMQDLVGIVEAGRILAVEVHRMAEEDIAADQSHSSLCLTEWVRMVHLGLERGLWLQRL